MRRVPDVATAHAKRARAHDDDICQAAQQRHHVSVRIREAADLAAAGVGLALAERHYPVEAGDEVADDRRPIGLEADAEPALEPVSYTHLRAHETRHDLVCRLLL